MSIVGIIPAAGKAERIDGLPKYLLPTQESFLLNELCDRMLAAGAEQLLIGANPDNRALIEQYAPNGAIVYTVNSRNMSETILAAQRWCGKSRVLFGMPDTYWTPKFIYDGMVADLENFPVVAACWMVRDDQIGKLGMVGLDHRILDKSGQNRALVINDVVDKPGRTAHKHAWGALAWRADFWDCISPDDPHVGYALQRALAKQLVVRAHLPNGYYFDCGTRSEYWKLARSFS